MIWLPALAGMMWGSACGERVRGPGYVISGAEEGSRMHGTPCGDVNGDGLEDILVNLEQARPGLGAFLVFGKSDEEPVDVAAIASGGAGSEALGRVIEPGLLEVSSFDVIASGDINGDGFADLVALSEPSRAELLSSSSVSMIHVIYGGPALPSPLRPAEITTGDGGFGVEAPPRTVVSANAVGDMNGDGFDELVISHSNDSSEVHYFLFGDSEPPSPTFEQLDADVGSFESDWLRRGGDVNGDGFDDFVSFSSGYTYSGGGQADIVVGGPSFGLPLPIDSGISFYYQWVVSAFDAGDVNGDGFDDLVFGVRTGNVAYVVFGGVDKGLFEVAVDADLGERGYVIDIGDPILDGSQDELGQEQIVLAGDANGDGLEDLIINSKDGSYLALGKKDTKTLVLRDEGRSLDDLPLGKHLGVVSGVGAIRGDGSKDLVISDPDAKVRGEKQSGRIYVLFDPDLAD